MCMTCISRTSLYFLVLSTRLTRFLAAMYPECCCGSRYYILPDTLNLDTLLVDLDQPKTRPKRPERAGAAGDMPLPRRLHSLFPARCPICFIGVNSETA